MGPSWKRHASQAVTRRLVSVGNKELSQLPPLSHIGAKPSAEKRRSGVTSHTGQADGVLENRIVGQSRGGWLISGLAKTPGRGPPFLTRSWSDRPTNKWKPFGKSMTICPYLPKGRPQGDEPLPVCFDCFFASTFHDRWQLRRVGARLHSAVHPW